MQTLRQGWDLGLGLGQVSSRWHLGPIHTALELLLDRNQHCKRQESGKAFPGPLGPFISREKFEFSWLAGKMAKGGTLDMGLE